ncbi:dipeptide transport system permease protein DppB [Sphingopyxis sp. FD7]|nr:dipeptide transport system permease protein DppB [Sphingopyxis sp. FD7]
MARCFRAAAALGVVGGPSLIRHPGPFDCLAGAQDRLRRDDDGIKVRKRSFPDLPRFPFASSEVEMPPAWRGVDLYLDFARYEREKVATGRNPPHPPAAREREAGSYPSH